MLSLNRFQRKYSHHINHGLSFFYLSKLREYIDFDFDVFLPTIGKSLQRGLVWTMEQKQALIISILRDQKLTPFVVIQRNDFQKDDKYDFQVIDGKQRLTTLFDFIDGKFPIEADGWKYDINTLPADCKKQILSYMGCTFNVHYDYPTEPISDQTKIDLFEDVNWLGTPQEIEHLNSLKNA